MPAAIGVAARRACSVWRTGARALSGCRIMTRIWWIGRGPGHGGALIFGRGAGAGARGPRAAGSRIAGGVGRIRVRHNLSDTRDRPPGAL